MRRAIDKEARDCVIVSSQAKLVSLDPPFYRVVNMDATHHYELSGKMPLKGPPAFTVFEVGATAATPMWVTLAIFTVNHFIEMHERQLHSSNMNGSPNLAPVRVKG